MIHYFSMGLILGLSGGLAPGPMMMLVISETLRHDVKAGIKVALAPLITDLPIVCLTVYVLSTLSGFDLVLGIISLIGGGVILSMGVKGICFSGVEAVVDSQVSRPLIKGVLANTFSPHPYLFWISVGAPTLTKAYGQSASHAIAFVLSFYMMLLGSKIMVAILVGRSRSVLKGKAYLYTMRGLGVMLCLLAVFLFRDGIRFLSAG